MRGRTRRAVTASQPRAASAGPPPPPTARRSCIKLPHTVRRPSSGTTTGPAAVWNSFTSSWSGKGWAEHRRMTLSSQLLGGGANVVVGWPYLGVKWSFGAAWKARVQDGVCWVGGAGEGSSCGGSLQTHPVSMAHEGRSTGQSLRALGCGTYWVCCCLCPVQPGRPANWCGHLAYASSTRGCTSKYAGCN